MRGYYEFPQNEHFVVLIRNESQEMPKLSYKAVEILNSAYQAAQSIEGWSILPWQAKVALVKNEILHIPLRARNPESGIFDWAQANEQYAWEILAFLNKYVFDAYPFRDNRPD